VYEHFHTQVPPGTMLAAAAAFQGACGGPSLIGQALFDWEARGLLTYADA